MTAECWVTISKRISAVSGSKVTESRSTFKGHIDTSVFGCRCDVSFRRYAVLSAEISDKVVQILMFLRPTFGGGSPEISLGICKSTPLPTYWSSLVEISWLVFDLC